MDLDYGRHYRDLYRNHWWWRAREHVIGDALRHHLADDRPAQILDVGCGDGLFFDRLLEFGEVEGLEASEDLLDPHGEHRRRIHVGPFDERFAPGHCYSVILMLDVLEHLPHPEAALRQVYRLLEPGGLFVATVPAFNLLWTTHDDLNQHHTRYRRSTLELLVTGAGLAMEESRYFFYWMVPAKLGVRLAERVRSPRPAVPSVPPHWMNRALYHISRVDEWLGRRLRLPVGSSLLAVARKAVTPNIHDSATLLLPDPYSPRPPAP